ncbi:glycosyltransferase family 2 protein [Ornithinimicrobium sufpigmenti]|uniref:glycosyltransferase family 2 protein n=1 Tax=Ornithinimicrobium sufpigmenti TaxID=2508882 RepID=UPI001036E4C2|nr:MULTISPECIES: glycosyltransferase family 2 protein [unclassified Ornithinimicrobium]
MSALPSSRPLEPSGPLEVVAVVPAKDEETRIGATIAALEQLGTVGWIVVVDDGSTDQTAAVAEWTGGVEVVRHDRNRGKAAAMTTGAARAAELAPGAPVLFVDADLEASAGNLGPVVEPVLAGEADMTIAVLSPQSRAGGGFGIVVRTARDGIRRLTGWAPTQPLSGQRCLSREALDAALPLASGWGVEVGLTVDVLRAGGRVLEVPCELHHRVTGRDLRSQVHRARQLADVSRALVDRSGAREKATARVAATAQQARGLAGRGARGAASGVMRGVTTAVSSASRRLPRKTEDRQP